MQLESEIEAPAKNNSLHDTSLQLTVETAKSTPMDQTLSLTYSKPTSRRSKATNLATRDSMSMIP